MRDTVIRLSLEKILVHLLQVVKRTNTPLTAYKKWRRRQDDGFFGSWVQIPLSTIKPFSDFPRVELEKYSPRYPQEMRPLGYWHVRNGLIAH